MPVDRDKEALVNAMEARLLAGPGTAPPELRSKAFEDRDVPDALAELIGKVAKRSFRMTDADFAAPLAAGFTEDQLFELVICAAAGESSRLYHAGLAALAEAGG
ncbi:MAG TPA: hypothetical protein VFS62_16485 [Chloroflexota bacterium]|jgi:hypothetical protein|nr:hypothetical protein [Chloroflexota bacterium]